MAQDTETVWSKDAARLDRSELAVIAHSMITARRALHGPLPSELIHDPALDLLTNLYIAGVSDELRTIEDLAAATTVAMPSVRRWIKALAQYGLIDGDDHSLCLSDEGHARVSEMLRAVAASQQPE